MPTAPPHLPTSPRPPPPHQPPTLRSPCALPPWPTAADVYLSPDDWASFDLPIRVANRIVKVAGADSTRTLDWGRGVSLVHLDNATWITANLVQQVGPLGICS